MKYILNSLLLCSVMFSSCNNLDKKQEASILLSTKTNLSIDSSGKKKSSKELLSSVVLHSFSDPIMQDTFELILTGKSILDGIITFQIISYNNRVIHNETFEAYDLLGDQADIIPSTKQKEDTITSRLRNFFSENNFSKPAIEATEPFDGDSTDIEPWEDIKSNRAAIGFTYCHGYESTYAIAYSLKKKKAVCYFYSD